MVVEHNTLSISLTAIEISLYLPGSFQSIQVHAQV